MSYLISIAVFSVDAEGFSGGFMLSAWDCVGAQVVGREHRQRFVPLGSFIPFPSTCPGNEPPKGCISGHVRSMPGKQTGMRKHLATNKSNGTFTSADFLANVGLGRRIVELTPKNIFFSQGDTADAVFYLQRGRAKLTVVSEKGKEATISLLSAGDFVGEESLAAIPWLRLATASAVNTCAALKITREEMGRVLNDEPIFADFFLKFMLARSMRTQADLVDQLFNSS